MSVADRIRKADGEVADRFRSAVSGVPGGEDLLVYWGLGKGHLSALMGALAAFCCEDRRRPLAHIAVRIRQALRYLYLQSGCLFPRWRNHLSDSLHVAVVSGDDSPLVLTSEQSLVFSSSDADLSQDYCWPDRILVVGVRWIERHFDRMVAPRGIGDPVYYVISRYCFGQGWRTDRMPFLCVSPDFRELAVMTHSGRIAAPCDLSVLVREALSWPSFESVGMAWSSYPANMAGDFLRRSIEAYAVLLAAADGLVVGSVHPFLSWVNRRCTRGGGWGADLRIMIERNMRRKGVAAALREAVKEIQIRSLAEVD